MKKLVSSLLVAVVALAGCQKKEKPVETPKDEKDKSQIQAKDETKQASETPVVEKQIEKEDSSSAYVAPIDRKEDAPAVSLVNVVQEVAESEVITPVEQSKAPEQPKVSEQSKVEKPVEQPKVSEQSKVETPVEQPKAPEQPKVEKPVDGPKAPEQPKVETPVEQPKAPEQPKVETPVEQPKAPEQPKVETPVERPKAPEQPKVETPVEGPKAPEQPKVETPVEGPKAPEQPKVETPVEQPKSPEQPKVETPVEGPKAPEQPKVETPVERPKAPEQPTIEPEVHEKPEYTVPIGGNIVEPEVHAKQEYTALIGGNIVEPEVHAKPEYTASIGGNIVEPEVHEKPEIERPKAPEQPKIEVHYELGESLVQPALPEFEFTRKVTTKKTTIIPPYVMLANMFMKEGETKVDFPGKDGLKEEEIEEIKDKDGNILATKLLKTSETKPIVKVTRFGTMTPTSDLGNTGLYNIREHFPNADFVQFNHAIKLTGDELKQLSPEERYKRANGKDENSLWLAGDPGHYIIANAPLSDDTVDKMNTGNYIDHKLVGKEMLKLVNEERVRVGKKELKWSDNLYEFAKIRAHELGENGHIRFYNNDNKAMPHTRDKSGKSWDTVFEGTKFYGRGYGENTAGYTMPRNIYQAFSEKTIAERLFNQWKGSKGHYANMIHDGYGYFAFDMNASKFWRNDKDSLDYLAQGIQGVQMFGGLNFEDKN